MIEVLETQALVKNWKGSYIKVCKTKKKVASSNNSGTATTIQDKRKDHGHRRMIVHDMKQHPECLNKAYKFRPRMDNSSKGKLKSILMFMQEGDFLFFYDAGLDENEDDLRALIKVVQDGDSPEKFRKKSFILTIDAEAPLPGRKRGCGGADNIESLIIATVRFDLFHLPIMPRSFGKGTWFSRSIPDLPFTHASKGRQMTAADKT